MGCDPPVAAGLAVSIIRDLLAKRLGVDAIALMSMVGALALGQPLAGAVIALMYSGGNMLEDIAVGVPNTICVHWSTGRLAWHIAKPATQSRTYRSATLPSAIRSWCVPARSFRLRCREVGKRNDRQIGGDWRNNSGVANQRCFGFQRCAQRRRDVRHGRYVNRGREHVCGHRASGHCGADRQGAFCAALHALIANAGDMLGISASQNATQSDTKEENSSLKLAEGVPQNTKLNKNE